MGALWELCVCFGDALRVLCGCFVGASWELCECFVDALRVLCGCFVGALWVLCGCFVGYFGCYLDILWVN